MKFLVDELPYYYDFCMFSDNCPDNNRKEKCPRTWDKYFVCSNDNPRECLCLKEFDINECKYLEKLNVGK